MTCHVVLWIPTIVYRGFSEANEKYIERNISDIPDKQLIVRVSLLEDGGFIVVTKSKDGSYNNLVSLEREEVSSNGLMSFTYKSTTDKESGFRFTTTEFPTAVYHIIKDFYHKHEFHDGENDSSLPPYVTCKKVPIRSNDNAALMHYLKTYSNVISMFVEYLQLAIRRTRIDKNDVKPEARELIQDMCLKAKGYEVYMGVLYRSKYNTQCRLDNTDNRELRHLACNIENGMRYIRLIEHEFSEYMQQTYVDHMIEDAKKSLKSSKRSIRIGLYSIALGVISLVIAIIMSSNSTKELHSVKQSMLQNLHNIPELIQESEKRDKELFKKQEDIQEEITVTQKETEKQLNSIENSLNKIIRNQAK